MPIDLSLFSTLSVEYRQAFDDLTMKANGEAMQEHVDQELAAAIEQETATADEEADRKVGVSPGQGS